MLLVPELWRDLDPRPIGVIRNPVAVRRSLERRGRERERHPELSAARWEELWTDLQPRAAAPSWRPSRSR